MKTLEQLSLLEHADLLGRYRYVELRLFGLCGRRCVELEGAARRWCSGAARAHAWRARCLEELAPISIGLPDVASITLPAGPAQQVALERLEAAEAAVFLAALVDTWYPAMAGAYRERLVRCHRAADAPLHRVLQRVVGDLGVVRSEGAEVTGEIDLGTFGQDLESLLSDAGGPFGPLTRSDVSMGGAQSLP